MKFGILTLVAAAAMFAFGAVVTAAHEPSPHPAQNATQCEAAGGDFSQPDGPSGINICTVETEGTLQQGVAASHPVQAWTVDVETPGTIETYTILGGTRTHTTQGGGDPVVVACYNHMGNSVSTDNPNCVPQ